jgi:hypothetical protein
LLGDANDVMTALSTRSRVGLVHDHLLNSLLSAASFSGAGAETVTVGEKLRAAEMTLDASIDATTYTPAVGHFEDALFGGGVCVCVCARERERERERERAKGQ